MSKVSIIKILFIPVLFLLIGIYTLPDYGINWDEPKHFARGQAYLHYILTGSNNYQNIPFYPMLNGSYDSKLEYSAPKSTIDPNSTLYRRSYYQSDVYSLDFLLENPLNIPDLHGHPEGNDFLAAISNRLFYGYLNILGDIESYHFFEIFVSFLLILGVSVFTYKTLGFFASFISTSLLATYPLFWAESHFNIKDPVIASFFGLTIISFYFGVIKNKKRLLFLSAYFAGLAFATKLNAAFLIPILFLWIIFYQRQLFKKTGVLILCAVLAFMVFVLVWPYLWFDPLGHISNMLNFYKGIGTTTESQWSSYAIKWITYSTPIPTLTLTIIGIFYSVKNIKKLKGFYFLVLTWLAIAVIRVSAPGAGIYGGVRQIMEFVPAMAIMAGIGGYALQSSKKKFLAGFSKGAIIAGIVFVLFENISIHPNQNVYFNQLVGGLKGARELNIDSWGNSFGNAYLQGINWINNNAPENAKLSLAIGNTINVPRIKLRDDILFSNSYWSGHLKEGEYIMELYFDWDPTNYYAYQYYDIFLDPVYQVQVDGVPILKIWKNDNNHTKKGYRETKKHKPVDSRIEEGHKLVLDMGKPVNLTKLIISPKDKDCVKSIGGYIALSDDENVWNTLPERIGGYQMRIDPNKFNLDETALTYFLAAEKARFIMIDTIEADSCLFDYEKLEIFGLNE